METSPSKAVFRGMAVCLFLALSGCVIGEAPPGHQFATGKITGRVVDANNLGAPDVEVKAIYLRNWTTIIPPVPPPAFVVASTRTGHDGSFTIFTSKRVDALEAQGPGVHGYGRTDSVTLSGNTICIDPPLPLLPAPAKSDPPR